MTLKASPAEFVFGQDMIYAYNLFSQLLMNLLDKKIKYRIPHEYHIGDKILIGKQMDKMEN